MSKILISGSRSRPWSMRNYAYACIEKAKANGDEIIVGDALGIDEDVVEFCQKLGVPYTCYGISPTPRNKAEVYVNTGLPDYTARDKHMIGLADKAMCIWNGESKGTLTVYQQATVAHKKAWLASFFAPDERFELVENDPETPWLWKFESDDERDVYIAKILANTDKKRVPIKKL